MRLMVVTSGVSVPDNWVDAVRPHWPGSIELVASNREALFRLGSPYFFPLMVCQADRETILQARHFGVQRFSILPCDTAQVVEEINSNILCLGKSRDRESLVQLHVMHNTLNSLCHKTAEIKNALQELSSQVQFGVDRVLSPQYA